MSRGSLVFAEYGPDSQQGKSYQSASDTFAPKGTDANGNILLPNNKIIANIDGSSRLFDARGRAGIQVPYSDTAAEAAMWFPLNETVPSGGMTFYDQLGQLSGGYGGGAYPRRFGGTTRPGAGFNGSSNRIALIGGSQAGFTVAARRIGDIKSLAFGTDMILMWASIVHPASIPADSAIISWGTNADSKGGWAFGLKQTSGKPTFWYRSRGGSATDTFALGTTGARGQNSDNLRTIMAMEIMKSSANNYIEIRGYQITTYTDGTNAQSNVGLETPLLTSNGGSGVTYDVTTPLMLGAWCDTNASTFTKLTSQGIYYSNVGAMRRPYQPGLGMLICQDLRASLIQGLPYEFPKSAS